MLGVQCVAVMQSVLAAVTTSANLQGRAAKYEQPSPYQPSPIHLAIQKRSTPLHVRPCGTYGGFLCHSHETVHTGRLVHKEPSK